MAVWRPYVEFVRWSRLPLRSGYPSEQATPHLSLLGGPALVCQGQCTGAIGARMPSGEGLPASNGFACTPPPPVAPAVCHRPTQRNTVYVGVARAMCLRNSTLAFFKVLVIYTATSIRSHSRELPHTNMNKGLLVHKNACDLYCHKRENS